MFVIEHLFEWYKLWQRIAPYTCCENLLHNCDTVVRSNPSKTDDGNELISPEAEIDGDDPRMITTTWTIDGIVRKHLHQKHWHDRSCLGTFLPQCDAILLSVCVCVCQSSACFRKRIIVESIFASCLFYWRFKPFFDLVLPFALKGSINSKRNSWISFCFKFRDAKFMFGGSHVFKLYSFFFVSIPNRQ